MVKRLRDRGPLPWPLAFDVTSTLAGLEIDAPRPFAKGAAETRATQVRIELPGGRVARTDVTLASGSARARLRFTGQGGHWKLDRGAARVAVEMANLLEDV